MFKTRITEMLGIEYPIIQSGMRYLGRARLVAAVSNAGALGILSAHTQPSAEALREEILATQKLTSKPFGINLTLLPGRDELATEYCRVLIECGVPVVETSGSNPAKYIDILKKANVKVVHKCTAVRFALKAESLGADAVTINGFECAGHPGEEDVPSVVLLPCTADKVKIPVVASGGFADGRGLVAALALGAEGINMGTRFAVTQESSAHPAVKQRMVDATERDTVLISRAIRDTTRVLKGPATEQVLTLEKTHEEEGDAYKALLKPQRWGDAVLEGHPDDAPLPFGMTVGLIHDIPTCAELVQNIINDARAVIRERLARMGA